ncbi:MAG: glycolate oxidase subunit GlcF [Nitrosomonas sp.]|nr:MAG: glycolate oxidase subunit GlcF [Nitrosomonas sp.]
MQTKISEHVKNTLQGQEADAILRSCVHCGFCLATCPTYQLLGDELDSPRGRIYLIKQMLEGQPVTSKTQLHLDRCLTCRACETTCPSGVRYGALVDIGRNLVEQQAKRNIHGTMTRYVLRKLLPNTDIFRIVMGAGRMVRAVLPARLRQSIPPRAKAAGTWPKTRHTRTMLVLDGCVQPVLAPGINAAAARVLDRLGISLIKASNAGCCGAVTFHLNAQQEGLDYMRRNIDAWWPLIENGQIEAIVMTASGCGVTVKEYGHLLQHEPSYAEKARHISTITKDLSEVVDSELERFKCLVHSSARGQKIKLAFHSPCTLQHGMKIRGVIEKILAIGGFDLTYVPDNHLCCGSAGTYSILQADLSEQLLKNKAEALESGQPALIATANIGCLMHLQAGTRKPVKHWIEIVDNLLVENAEKNN